MDETIRLSIDNVVTALGGIRCGAACTETELHELAAQALSGAGIAAEHEARLAPRCRIDFLAGEIGIEIKKKRPERSRLLEQLNRYAACDQVAALVVVAPRGVNLPAKIGGKPVKMLSLERLWGIFLP